MGRPYGVLIKFITKKICDQFGVRFFWILAVLSQFFFRESSSIMVCHGPLPVLPFKLLLFLPSLFAKF